MSVTAFASLRRQGVIVSLAAAMLLVVLILLAGLPNWLAVPLAATSAIVPMLGWRQAARRVESLSAQLIQMIERAPCAALVLSDTGVVLRANRHCQALFGLSVPLASGASLSALPSAWQQCLSEADALAQIESVDPLNLRSVVSAVRVDVAVLGQMQSCKLLLIDPTVALSQDGREILPLSSQTHSVLQRIVDVIPYPVYLKDSAGRYFFVNQAFADERAMRVADLQGKTAADVISANTKFTPNSSSYIASEDVEILAGKDVWKEESAIHPGTGSEVHRYVSKRSSVGEHGIPVIVCVHYDITTLRVAERALQAEFEEQKALRERTQIFVQHLINVIPQPVYVKDANSRYLLVNTAFCKQRMLDDNQLIGKAPFELAADPEKAKRVVAEDQAVLNGMVVSKEEEMSHPVTGALMFRWLSKQACTDAYGNAVVVGSNVDLTEWRNAERKLQDTLTREQGMAARVQAFTQRLIDVIPQPVYVKDAQSRYVMVNATMAREFGKSAEDLVGQSPLTLGAAPDYAALVMGEDAKIVAGLVVYKEEHIKHPYNGQEIYRIISKGTCAGADGLPVIVGANVDITPQRVAERQAKEALVAQSHVKDFLESLLNSLPSPLYVEDVDGRLLMVNRAFRLLVGEPTRELIGTETIGYGPDRLRASLARCHSQALAVSDEAKVFESEFHFATHDARRHYMLRAVSGQGLEGQSVVVGVLSDVSTQREAEAVSILAKEEAERASGAKSLFLASMSHEIRTPLAGVIGTLNLAMRDDAILAATRKLMTDSLTNAESLLHIINDILDFSKIEAGQLSLESIDYDLRRVAVDSLRLMHNTASARSLQLVLDIDPKLPSFFKGDPTRLRQVLINLVGNALKFTHQGSVALRATQLADADGCPRVRFRIEDTGIGISEEAIKRLFGKFQQADVSTTRKYGGTGLGLAICRELVEAMGGEIGVTSKLGVGTTFEFILPMPLGEEPKQVEEAVLTVHARSLRVLCAEDYATNQLIISALLDDMGHTVTMVDNGLEAVRALSEQDYDVVLMDGRKPEMDAMEATRAVRAGGLEGMTVRNPLIPIIALTANASSEDRAAFMASGMNDFLTKPIELRKLHEALGRVLGKGYGDAAAMAAVAEVSASAEAHAFTAAIAANESTPDHSNGAPVVTRPEGLSLKLHVKLIGMFADSIPKRLEDLERHIVAADLEGLSALAHGVRGSASMLGAKDIPETAGKVEEAAKHGARDEALSLCPALVVALQRFLDHRATLCAQEVV